MILIRPFAPRDRAALWRILAPIIEAGDVYALPRDMSEADTVGYWTGGDHEAFIAEQSAQIVGAFYIRANQLGGGSHVANAGFATGAEARGKGVARTMCLAAMARARDRGFKAMQFNFVVATNAPAVHLWTSLGFEIIGRLPLAFHQVNRGYCDALVMYRAL